MDEQYFATLSTGAKRWNISIVPGRSKKRVELIRAQCGSFETTWRRGEVICNQLLLEAVTAAKQLLSKTHPIHADKLKLKIQPRRTVNIGWVVYPSKLAQMSARELLVLVGLAGTPLYTSYEPKRRRFTIYFKQEPRPEAITMLESMGAIRRTLARANRF